MRRRLVSLFGALSLVPAATTGAQEPQSWGTVDGGPTANVVRAEDAIGLLPDRRFVATGDFPVTNSRPLADSGRIFGFEAAFGGGVDIIAFDIASRTIVWQKRQAAPLYETGGRSAAGDGIIAFDARSGITGISQASGATLWTQPGVDSQRVVVHGGTVFVLGEVGAARGLFAFAAETGVARWSVLVPDLPLDGPQPVIAGDNLVAQRPDGALLAVDTATGDTAWSAAAGGADTAGENRSYLVSDGDSVFTVDRHGRVAAVDATSGTVRWSRDVTCAGQLVADQAKVFCRGTGGAPLALRRDTGAVAWTAPFDVPGRLSREGQRLYAGRTAYDAATGAVVATGSYSPRVTPHLIYGRTLFATVYDEGNNFRPLFAAFSDVTAPALSLAGPGPFVSSSRPALTWTASDSSSGVAGFTVTLDGQAVTELSSSARTYDPGVLADGQHTWSVRARDHADNEVTRSGAFVVDTRAPDETQLALPAAGDTLGTRSLTFSWQGAGDAGGSGVVRYELLLDGQVSRADDACCSAAVEELARGEHTWAVRAIDAAGNASLSPARTFTISIPPAAALDGPRTAVLTGTPLTFDASASAGAFGGPLTFAWDFDGNGSFEVGPNPSPTVVRTYGQATKTTVTVRVTDGDGAFATASLPIDVRQAPPPGPVGISINGGARFTNDRDVTITAAWPALTEAAILSNDGGFAAGERTPVAASIPWRLDGAGSERLPRIVYARFDGGEYTGLQSFSDDIILDESPPVLRSVRSKRTSGKRYRLTIKASDATSGVAQAQVTTNRRTPPAFAAFKRRVAIRTGGRKAFVRVRDSAGNTSGWKRVALRR